MRVSLLLRREKFGPILEQTLAHYWGSRFGQSFEVRWGRRQLRGEGQCWHGNHFLNFFACSATPSASFSSVRRDFGRSPSWRSRLLQRAYVTAGTLPPVWPLLAHSTLTVTPPCPDGGRVLIMGGNHRLRILEPRQNRYVIVLKAGMPAYHIENEVAFRQQHRLTFVPALLEVGDDCTWFAEAFAEGTGATRMPPTKAQRVIARALEQLKRKLTGPTLAPVCASEIARQDAESLATLVKDPVVSPGNQSTVFALVERLREFIQRHDVETATAWTHGDFQPTNMVGHGEQAWVVDWESVRRRFCGYDVCTLLFDTRRGGLCRNLSALLRGGAESIRTELRSWPGMNRSPCAERPMLALYLLAELVFRAEESLHSQIINPSASLQSAVQEIEKAACLLVK